MAQSILSVPIPAGHLSVHLETVIILPLSLFHRGTQRQFSENELFGRRFEI